MSDALVKYELQEKDLELVVNEKTLGCLTTNAKHIQALIESALPHYDISNYNEGNIAFAKKDKALLNGTSKALNDKRIQFEKEFMQPFAEFKAVVNDTVALIKDCSNKIDVVIKQSEETEKQKKRFEIDDLWEKKGFNLVPLSKIFDAKWLNKTATIKTIDAEMAKKIADINDDIATIEAIGADVELLKSIYLDTLNVNTTIQYANTLKQNRIRAEADALAKAQEAIKPKPEIIPEAVLPVTETASVPIRSSPPPASLAPEQDIYIRAFKVTTTRENIIQLGNFMNQNGIKFEKIEL